VPQEVVRRLLDHTSHTMTAVYAAWPTAPFASSGNAPRRSTSAVSPSTQRSTDRSPTANG
jgi:hypothetical protein